MDSKTKIRELKHIISESLSPLIQRKKVALFGLPFHGNIGDSLISLGEFTFIKDVRAKCIYTRQLLDTDTPYPKLPDECIVLLQGGGDFGDVWRGIQEERIKIIKQYPNNTIIIFPQTVNYANIETCKRDSENLEVHKKLHICARDLQSYEFLTSNFVNSILLVPDMAFYIPIERLTKFCAKKSSGQLYLKRGDKEFNNSIEIQNLGGSTISDWPITDNQLRCIKNNFAILGITGALRLRNYIRSATLLQKITLKYITKYGYWTIARIGVEFISKFDRLTVTRLHAGILSLLINKPVTILDNSYGKNRNFYDTWLKNVESVTFIRGYKNDNSSYNNTNL